MIPQGNPRYHKPDAEKIERLMKRYHLTREAFAIKADISPQTLRRALSGDPKMLGVFVSMADGLNQAKRLKVPSDPDITPDELMADYSTSKKAKWASVIDGGLGAPITDTAEHAYRAVIDDVLDALPSDQRNQALRRLAQFAISLGFAGGLGCFILGLCLPNRVPFFICGTVLSLMGFIAATTHVRRLVAFGVLASFNFVALIYFQPIRVPNIPSGNPNWSATESKDNSPSVPRILAEDDPRPAIENCISLIRKAQLADGAICMSSNGEVVWIEPYFCSYGALALLAASKDSNSAKDVEHVQSWLKWYADHIDAEVGVSAPHYGPKSGYSKKGEADRVDAYAGMYLLTTARFHEKNRSTPIEIQTAAKTSLRAIEKLCQEDGLTVSRTNSQFRFLQSNCEAYWGLSESVLFFTSIGDDASAATAKKLARGIEIGATKFHRENHYVYSIDKTGSVQDTDELGQRGIANLVALSYIGKPNRSLWDYVNQKYSPDTGVVAAAPIEWWLIAAGRSGNEADQKSFRKRSIEEAKNFNHTMYVNRLGLMVLALVDGDSRLPAMSGERAIAP